MSRGSPATSGHARPSLTDVGSASTAASGPDQPDWSGILPDRTCRIMTVRPEHGLNNLSCRPGLVADQRPSLAPVRPASRSRHGLPGQLLLFAFVFAHGRAARRFRIQLPGLWRRTPTLIQPPHLDFDTPIITRDTHQITNTHFARRLDPGPVDLHPATTHGPGSQRAVPEKARRPQPFVYPQCVHAGQGIISGPPLSPAPDARAMMIPTTLVKLRIMP